MSMLSCALTSLNWMYKASASLSYSILKSNHLHPLFFLTALMTKNLFSSSLYVTLRNFPEVSTHELNLPSMEGSRYAGSLIANSISFSKSCVTSSYFLRALYILSVSLIKSYQIDALVASNCLLIESP
jgi:hypothetical protein